MIAMRFAKARWPWKRTETAFLRLVKSVFRPTIFENPETGSRRKTSSKRWRVNRRDYDCSAYTATVNRFYCKRPHVTRVSRPPVTEPVAVTVGGVVRECRTNRIETYTLVLCRTEGNPGSLIFKLNYCVAFRRTWRPHSVRMLRNVATKINCERSCTPKSHSMTAKPTNNERSRYRPFQTGFGGKYNRLWTSRLHKDFGTRSRSLWNDGFRLIRIGIISWLHYERT